VRVESSQVSRWRGYPVQCIPPIFCLITMKSLATYVVSSDFKQLYISSRQKTASLSSRIKSPRGRGIYDSSAYSDAAVKRDTGKRTPERRLSEDLHSRDLFPAGIALLFTRSSWEHPVSALFRHAKLRRSSRNALDRKFLRREKVSTA
jgi:hypothetical protein